MQHWQCHFEETSRVACTLDKMLLFMDPFVKLRETLWSLSVNIGSSKVGCDTGASGAAASRGAAAYQHLATATAQGGIF
jgi:hypothetical protein